MKQLAGYAAMFDSLSQDLGGFQEVIRRGAFDQTLKSGDARFLWSHSESDPLGRVSAGGLRLSTDSTGLRFELDLPNTVMARDLLDLVERRIITAMSFGFSVPRDGDTWRRAASNGLPLRELVRIDLKEISACAWPAYLSTSVTVRTEASGAQPVAAVPFTSRDLDMKKRRLRLIELTAA